MEAIGQSRESYISIDKLILDSVADEFGVGVHSHLLQNSCSISAYSLVAKREHRRNLRESFS